MWSKLAAIIGLQFFIGNLMWSKLCSDRRVAVFFTGNLMRSKLCGDQQVALLFTG